MKISKNKIIDNPYDAENKKITDLEDRVEKILKKLKYEEGIKKLRNSFAFSQKQRIEILEYLIPKIQQRVDLKK
ncbi:MAG: hypothetical protein WCV55_03485 [Candidatus Paceibacterota bacterium]